MRPVIAGLAASLLVAASVLWISLAGGSGSVYAQATQALKTARSAHVVLTDWEEGREVRAGEAWFDQERGLVLTTGTTTELSTPDTHWRHTQGSPFAVKLPQEDPRRRLLETFGLMLEKLREGGNLTRVAELDATIDGVPLRAHAVTSASQGERLVVLLDPQDRLRRLLQEHRSEGGLRPSAAMDIRYDVAVDPKRFAAAPPEGVRLVSVDELLGDRYSLERALHTEEGVGMIFALHQVRQGPDGLLFAVASIRPAEAAKAGRKKGFFGGYVGMHSARAHQALPLGSANTHVTTEDLVVIWGVQVPQPWLAYLDEEAAPGAPITLRFRMISDDPRYKNVDARGVDMGHVIDVSVKPPAGEPATLEQIADEMHEQASLLLTVGSAGLQASTGRFTARSLDPSKVSRQQWRTELANTIKLWQVEDKGAK